MERPRRHRALAADIRYLALGDSYTIGTGASNSSHAWPSIVARHLETKLGRSVQLMNPAVNGYTTVDLIRDELRFLRLDPDLVTVLIGVNDLVQGRTLARYESSLAEIYDALAGRRVVAISIPDWYFVPAAAAFGGADHVQRLTSLFNDLARDQALAHSFEWVDIGPASRSGVGSKGWIASDELHPGDAQYAAWADVIAAAVLGIYEFRSGDA